MKKNILSLFWLLVLSSLVVSFLVFLQDKDSVNLSKESIIAQVVNSLSDGLIAHYKFDESSGTVATDYIGNNSGTLMNGPLWISSGKINGAIQLDGINDYISLPTSLLSTVGTSKAYTLSLWFKRTSNSTASLISISDSPNNRNGIGIHSSGIFEGGHYDGVKWVAHRKYINSTFNDTWHHVVLVNDDQDNSRLYIDNVNQLGTGPYSYTLGSGNAALIGSGASVFSGLIDDVRIYNRALSVTEVEQLYNYTESSVPPPPGQTSNQAPVVSAGNNQTITLPANATMAGTATDDGLPNGSNLTTTWSMLSGPGTATFANQNSLTTTVTFSQSGTYTLRLTATDGTATSNSDVVISVNNADTSLPVTDSTAPEIISSSPSGVLSSNLSQVTIEINTNEPSSCKYSSNSGDTYDRMSNFLNTGNKLYHSVLISNLTAGNQYNYYIRCSDLSGNVNTTDKNISFSLPQLTTNDQFIIDFTPKSLPSWAHYTNVILTTNRNASCKISKSESSFKNINDVTASTLSQSHSFPVYGLLQGATNKYFGYCTDSSGNLSPAYPINIAVESDNTKPSILDVSTTFLYFDLAVIQWNTSEPTNSLFEYGISENLGTRLDYDSSFSIPHAVTLPNLLPNTKYYYRITSKDKAGNSVISDIQTFTTLSNVYAYEVYVSNGGSDTNTGSLSSPFASIDKATTNVNSWINSNPQCNSPVMIWIRGGEYFRNKQLDIYTHAKINCPVIYSSYPGEEVIFTGSKNITGFTKVTDENILNRLPSVSRGKVYQVNLTTNGISDLGDLRNVSLGVLSPPELIFNGQVMQLSKYPNNIEDVIKINSLSYNGLDPVLGYGFDTRPERWASSSDIWVHGWFHYDWSDHTQRVKSFDLLNKKIVLDSSKLTSTNGANNANANNGYGVYNNCCAGFYYFKNILEEIDSPGEYMIDRTTGILYFWPPSDIDSARIQLSISTSNFVKGYSAQNIIFKNLIFENTRNTAFSLTKSDGVVVADSTIRNIGASAFIVTGSEQNNRNGVYNSKIYNIGSYGISLYSIKNSSLTGGRNFALSNEIYNTGRWNVTNFGGAPIYTISTSPYISHNKIYNQLNLGIYLYNVNNGIVEFNDVFDVMKLANDNSGIYVGGDNLNARGNIVRYNYVHDIYGVPWNKTADGIYFDNATPGDIAYGNIIDTVAPIRSPLRVGGAFMIGAGRNIIIENNIVYNSQVGVYLNVWSNASQLLSTIGTITNSEPYRTFYPENTIINSSSGLYPDGNIISKNIFYLSNPWSSIVSKFLPYIDINNNLINTDPHFVDINNRDYRLIDSSPAYTLGFKRIPFEKIGLLKNVNTNIVINGICGNTNNSCGSGSYYDQLDSDLNYLWQCRGTNGGSTANCSALIPKSGEKDVPKVVSNDVDKGNSVNDLSSLSTRSSGGGSGIANQVSTSFNYSAPQLINNTKNILDKTNIIPIVPQKVNYTNIGTTKFTKNLRIGQKSPDVRSLQRFLNSSGFIVSITGPGSIGRETDYFGPATFRALIKFQENYSKDILLPVGLKKGTGYFGPSTIKKVNLLINN